MNLLEIKCVYCNRNYWIEAHERNAKYLKCKTCGNKLIETGKEKEQE